VTPALAAVPAAAGQYAHVINDTGAPASGTSTTPSAVVSYP
jgi:hypothetical protein